jgi:hypothetical protein
MSWMRAVHASLRVLRDRSAVEVRALGRLSAGVAVWLLLRLEAFAVIAAVILATWAVWDGLGAPAGRAMLALGLLFLGGGISRLMREVRGG